MFMDAYMFIYARDYECMQVMCRQADRRIDRQNRQTDRERDRQTEREREIPRPRHCRKEPGAGQNAAQARHHAYSASAFPPPSPSRPPAPSHSPSDCRSACMPGPRLPHLPCPRPCQSCRRHPLSRARPTLQHAAPPRLPAYYRGRHAAWRWLARCLRAQPLLGQSACAGAEQPRHRLQHFRFQAPRVLLAPARLRWVGGHLHPLPLGQKMRCGRPHQRGHEARSCRRRWLLVTVCTPSMLHGLRASTQVARGAHPPRAPTEGRRM